MWGATSLLIPIIIPPFPSVQVLGILICLYLGLSFSTTMFIGWDFGRSRYWCAPAVGSWGCHKYHLQQPVSHHVPRFFVSFTHRAGPFLTGMLGFGDGSAPPTGLGKLLLKAGITSEAEDLYFTDRLLDGSRELKPKGTATDDIVAMPHELLLQGFRSRCVCIYVC